MFKIVLLLITILCYGSTVFEWDDNECEKNYQNECHLYNTEKQTNIDFSVNLLIPSKFTIDLPENPNDLIENPKIKSLLSLKHFFKKTDKIFLLHKTFRI